MALNNLKESVEALTHALDGLDGIDLIDALHDHAEALNRSAAAMENLIQIWRGSQYQPPSAD